MRHRWMQDDISHQHRAQSPKYQLDIGTHCYGTLDTCG